MDGADERLLARVALSCSRPPGDPVLAAELRAMGPMAALLSRPDAREHLHRAASVITACADSDVEIIVPASIAWPTQLDDLPAPPVVLYTRGGPLRAALLPSVAVVGSRSATPEGLRIARTWAAQLARAGCRIVSGAAFGIDAAAHKGALDVGGCTIAVLAGGVDVPSPRAHADMLAEIARYGTIVSEAPPGSAPARHLFLVRNRLIAALAPATLVVQAASRSGALSTARQAAEMHRIVMAVPGAVSDGAHAGCAALIRDRLAELVVGPQDVMSLVLPLATAAADVLGAAQGNRTAR